MFKGEYQPTNSTTARKPGNDMKKNKSVAQMGDSPAAWQKADKGLGFNGQDNGSSQRAKAVSIQVNQHTGRMNDDTGFGQTQMPNRKGNIANQSDRTRTAPSTANRGMTKFSNPDSINMGAGPRNAGSTRPWDPSAGQNYRGNPSMIQERQLYNNKGNKD
jgi:hypothetical protein